MAFGVRPNCFKGKPCFCVSSQFALRHIPFQERFCGHSRWFWARKNARKRVDGRRRSHCCRPKMLNSNRSLATHTKHEYRKWQFDRKNTELMRVVFLARYSENNTMQGIKFPDRRGHRRKSIVSPLTTGLSCLGRSDTRAARKRHVLNGVCIGVRCCALPSVSPPGRCSLGARRVPRPARP